MHKELFIEKYYFVSKIIQKQFTTDLNAVIAHEIEKAKGQPVVTDQVTDQDAPKFDQDRFEAMFRAVVISRNNSMSNTTALNDTIYYLKQLDAYYATKKGGNNE
jgi:hypothetical protein